MSKYEERAFRVGRTKTDIAGMKNQLARLKHDLEQFKATKPGGPMIEPLRLRIRELEETIANAEADKKRRAEAAAARAGGDDDGDGAGRSRPSRGHFPPRGSNRAS